MRGVLGLEPEHGDGQGAGVEDAAEVGVHALHHGQIVGPLQQLRAVDVVLQRLHTVINREKCSLGPPHCKNKFKKLAPGPPEWNNTLRYCS